MSENGIEVAEACDQTWEEMEGDDEAKRRCDKCDREVHRISEMTPEEVEQLFEQREGDERVCGWVEFDADGDPKFAEASGEPIEPGPSALYGWKGTAIAATVAAHVTCLHPGMSETDAADEVVEPLLQTERIFAERLAEEFGLDLFDSLSADRSETSTSEAAGAASGSGVTTDRMAARRRDAGGRIQLGARTRAEVSRIARVERRHLERRLRSRPAQPPRAVRVRVDERIIGLDIERTVQPDVDRALGLDRRHGRVLRRRVRCRHTPVPGRCGRRDDRARGRELDAVPMCGGDLD
ncbi:MAG: hypothetical protein ABEN55_02660 [Bradymonadaceae bacterium]